MNRPSHLALLAVCFAPMAPDGLCDWNGDGLLDFLVGEIQGHIFYFQNCGTRREPKFARGQFLVLDGQPLRFLHDTTPCAVDWDDDGDEDLLVSSSYSVAYLLERSYLDGGYAEASVVGVERRKP